MTGQEIPVVFPCAGETLVGIRHAGGPDARTGVVVVVGGPQYRIGSHRQFVELARTLSAAGIPVLRFDFRGMGDSGGTWQGIDQVGADIRAAIDALLAVEPTVDRVVLWGLCDGASAILLHAHGDPRVAGAVLLNPWVRTAATFARTQLRHYYLRKLAEPQFWRRLASGQVGIGPAIADALGALRSALGHGGVRASSSTAAIVPRDLPLPDRMALGLAAYRGAVLLILSGNDLTAREFEGAAGASERWRTLLAEPRIARRTLAEADHTFARRSWSDTVAVWTRDWVAAL